ncbi:MAG: hypothetical protein SFX72_09010 [Isosphaeraceae bacterium]|nr:hypothetical protein [Isosphaeraceae bacterium]
MFSSTRFHARRGFQLLDVQAALVVLGIALAGLIPIAVAQLRLIKRIESRSSLELVQFLVPESEPWARKLGAAPRRTIIDPGSFSGGGTLSPVNTILVDSVATSSADDTASVIVTVIPIGG